MTVGPESWVLEDVDAVNVQLEKMGYNIGLRLVDEFLALGGQQYMITCSNNHDNTQYMINTDLSAPQRRTEQCHPWRLRPFYSRRLRARCCKLLHIIAKRGYPIVHQNMCESAASLDHEVFLYPG